MSPIEDHAYMKLCAELASSLSISIASARRQVELAAARDGVKNLDARKAIAENLLNKVRSSPEKQNGAHLDELLKALASDENFMVED